MQDWIIALLSFPHLKFLPKRNVQERLHQYLEIEPPRAMLQIEQVIAQTVEHLLQRIRIAFHDLVDVELAFRTGADKRHITDEDIP